MVNTVLGPMETSEMGRTLMHEHAVCFDMALKNRIVLNRCWSIYSRLVVCSGICNIRYSSSRGCLPEAGEKCMIPDICHQSVSIECGTVCGSIWEMRYILLYVLRRSGEL